ncbi:unnamed protein product [Camellia sinensis]
MSSGNSEMDFHSMKREELQALCKKHKIPANLTNLEMANKLSSLLEEKEKPNRRGQSCLNLKNKGEIVSENDSNGITRQFKKVRLSPENEMVDFVDMEAEPVEIKRVENPVRKTRSRAPDYRTANNTGKNMPWKRRRDPILEETVVTEGASFFEEPPTWSKHNAETTDFEEAKALKMANSVEILATKSVKFQNDNVEEETLFSVSGSEVDKENPLQDDISRVNEDDLALHSSKSTEFESNNLFEPEEDLKVSMDPGVPQATSGDESKHSENLDLGKEMERDEDPTTTGKYIDSSCVVAHNGVDDDKVSVFAEQNLLEFEDGDSPGELKNLELAVEDYLVESNECSSSMKTSENVYVEAGQISIVDLSETERIRPTTNSGLSEREVADSAGNPALSSSKKVSEDTYIRRQESSSNSCLKKQCRLMEVCTQNTDIDEIRALMMVEGTPSSNSVKLQSDSVELGQHVPASESLVVTETENIVLVVASNKNLFQDDIHKGDDHDLVSRSQIQSGDFDHKTLVNLEPVEDQDKHVEDDLKTLFATPDKNTNPGEEAASSHEPEMDDLRMQEGSTISNMKNGRKMTYKENASLAATEEKVTKVNGTTEKVLELVGNEFIAESHVVDANIDCQCSEATIPHTAHFAPEYQASGTSDKELSSSELRLSIDNEIQDEGTKAIANDFLNLPVIQSAIVTEAKDSDKSIERDLHVECSKLVTEEENVEFLSEIGFGDPNNCQELVPQSDAGLTETPCKESEVSEEKIMVEFIKSSSKCIDKTNMLKEEVNEVALTSFGQLGISKIVFDHGDEFAITNANGLDASDMLSEKDAKENVILAVTKADFKDSDNVLMEDVNSVVPEHNEVKHNDYNIDKDGVVAELEKGTFTDSDEIIYGKEDEDLSDISNKFEVDVPQVSEMKLELDEEQNSESHVHQGGLSSGAEGSEATEVDQVNLFDDHGNGPASLDKSFREDKYLANEKVVGGMMDNLSIDTTDGSDVGENVFSEQKFSNTQLVGQEDVLEEDAIVSGVGGLALNNPLRGSETKRMCVGEYGEQQNFSQASTLKYAINDDCAAYHDESIYESDEVLMKEKDVAKKSRDCRYSENELVEVEKSSICIDEPADSVDLRLDDDFKSSEEGSITKRLLGGHRSEERIGAATELRENVLKSNSMMEDQSSQFTELAVGGTAAAEVAAEMWRPNSESVEVRNSLTKLNSTTIRRKNEQSSLI